jgi:hypothetical protein
MILSATDPVGRLRVVHPFLADVPVSVRLRASLLLGTPAHHPGLIVV